VICPNFGTNENYYHEEQEEESQKKERRQNEEFILFFIARLKTEVIDFFFNTREFFSSAPLMYNLIDFIEVIFKMIHSI
jgi:hypothetical protein